MKKHLFLFLAIFTITLNCLAIPPVDSSQYFFRPWWAVALCDAAGALGGAGSVQSFTGGIANTTPVGWVATGVGALIGGAAASIAASRSAAVHDAVVSNSANDMDYIGVKHNEILEDFLNSGQEFTTDNYYTFVLANPEKYGIDRDSVFITKANVESIVRDAQSANLTTTEDGINYLIPKLPRSVNAGRFRSAMSVLLNATSKEDFNRQVLDIENSFINDRAIKSLDLAAIKSFFSTLRNSTAYWEAVR